MEINLKIPERVVTAEEYHFTTKQNLKNTLKLWKNNKVV